MVSDGLFLMGAALVVTGVSWWSVPAAFILTGLFFIAIAPSMKGGRRGRIT